jgi:xylose isomerase
MDAFARGLKIAAAMRKDGAFSKFITERYASWGTGIGATIEKGNAKFEDLEKYMLEEGRSDSEYQRPAGVPGECV